MLHEFLNSHREEIISRCREKVAKRNSPQPSERELEYGIPLFLSQLTEMLLEESRGSKAWAAPSLSKTTEPTIAIGIRIGEAASSHGHELLLRGFSVYQVVLDYGDLCQAVTELAIERNAEITVDEFHTLNRCLDDAVAGAVSEFARRHDRVIAEASESTENERAGFFAGEYRNLISTAILAVDAIKRGHVGIAGTTGSILDRSLASLQDLTARAFVDVRREADTGKDRPPVMVSEFIKEIRVAAAIDAMARDIEFIVADIDLDLTIDVDYGVLAGALANVLQNAFKFTKPRSSISLKAFSLADRVLIVVEDECGGLPLGNAEDLFRPFEQRSSDQSGPGLGLGISRHGVEANGGKLYVRDLPGKGCVFTIDLPKPPASATPTSNVA